MTTSHFTTSILVEASAQEVYKAINNVSGWWHGEIDGPSEQLNDEFDYRYKDFHYSRQRVVELIPNERVVWLVTDSQLNFLQDKSEWTGTRIIFEITEIQDKTQVRFTHFGLVPTVECYTDCFNGWTGLIQESLSNLITTGKGVKVFG